MARYIGPRTKLKRRFKLLPESPADEGRRRGRRKSDYGIRLEEKQKLKFIYGVLEKQFRRCFAQASQEPRNTGQVLLQLLETRLDNVVYRLGFALTRPQARQLVAHGHVLVDEQKVDVPAYNVRAGQTVTLKPVTLENLSVQEAMQKSSAEDLATWLVRKGPVGKVERLPEGKDLRDDIDLNLIIEYYSR